MDAACGRRVLEERACVQEKLLRQACICWAQPEACKALEPQQLARPSQAGASAQVQHLVLPASDPAPREDKQRGCRAEHSYQRDMVELVLRVLAEIAPPQIANDAKRIKNVTMSVFGMLNWFYKWNPKANRSARVSYSKTVASLTLVGVKGNKAD